MNKYAIIVAAGSGTRMGGDVPKQFQLLKTRPLLWYAIKAFADAYSDIGIILVLHPDYIETGKKITHEFPERKFKLVAGGETRFHSVKNGLEEISENSLVFVHDGVRILTTPEMIRRCGEEAIKKGNAVPAITATDTIRIETASGNEVIDRNKVRFIQTPQVFFSDDLKKAFEQDYDISFTDEASVIEKQGAKINLVEGEITNIKITKPADFMIAEYILETLMDANRR